MVIAYRAAAVVQEKCTEWPFVGDTGDAAARRGLVWTGGLLAESAAAGWGWRVSQQR